MIPSGLLSPALAEGAELVVVSGYVAARAAGPVRVVLDRHGASILLVLASYEAVHWQLDVHPGTRLAGVVVSAYRDVMVAGQGSAPVYRLALPCATLVGSAPYMDLLRVLEARLGRRQVDIFRAYARLPEQVAVAGRCSVTAAGATAIRRA